MNAEVVEGTGHLRQSCATINGPRIEILTQDFSMYHFRKDSRLKTNKPQIFRHLEQTPWSRVLLEKLIVAQKFKK
jgi:hypothetical protein